MGFRKLGFIAAIALATNSSWAEDHSTTSGGSAPPDIEKVCSQTACRTGGYEAVVGVDPQRYTTIPVTRSPYILDDGSVLIFPGETIAVQLAVDGGKLGRPMAAERYAPEFPALIVKSDGAPEANPENASLAALQGKMPADEVANLPPNTLVVSYGQFKEKGESGMTLTLLHNFSQTIKLDAIIAEIRPNAYEQHYTSTCPVRPKMSDFENWPNALGPLVLKNFRFQADGQSVVCE